jgi:O-antigen ligase
VSAFLAAVRRGAGTSTLWLATLLGITIPVSVAADHIVMVLFLVAWLVSGRLAPVARAVRDVPVAAAATLLLALLFLGGLWGPGTTAEYTHYLGKDKELLFVALWLPCFVEPVWRQRAITALLWLIVIMLVVSYASAFGMFELVGLGRGGYGDHTAFKNQITHGFLVALGAFLFAVRALSPEFGRTRRGVFAIAAVLAVVNVLAMIKGRTGYVVIVVLAAYLVMSRLQWRARIAVFLAGVLAVGGLFTIPGTFRDRVHGAVIEAQEWKPGTSSATSIGQRLNFYSTSLAMIARRPLIGAGTGGFEAAYIEQVQGTGTPPSKNPHNQYLLVTGQLGVIGLAAFVGLLVVAWRGAVRLPTALEKDMARGLVLAMATGCLFNSLLLDHTEGMLFCWLLAVLYGGYRRRPDADVSEPVGLRAP